MKMKKILAMTMALVLVAGASIFGTLAYLTSTDEAVNTFAIGNIKIDLQETIRDGSAYVDKETLMPIVGSAQGEKDSYGYPVAENYIDKTVDVENVGKNNAYVRVVMAFPADMDDAQSAAEMMLHWNYLDTEESGYWTREDAGVKMKIEGRDYNLYVFTYLKEMEPEDVTKYPAIIGVYLDSRVDVTVNDNETVTYTMVNGRGETVTATYPANGGPQIHVFAQGVQADGFGDADTALNAAFGEITATNNPWYEAVTE